MLFVLVCGEEEKLAVYHNNLMQTKRKQEGNLSIELNGLNLDLVWENIIVDVGGVEIEQCRSLDEQIVVDAKRRRIDKELNRLEKIARTERQPNKKFEIVLRINKCKKELEEI